jgi:hypothetical protein
MSIERQPQACPRQEYQPVEERVATDDRPSDATIDRPAEP